MQSVCTSSLPARWCQLYSSTGLFTSSSRYGFLHQFTSFPVMSSGGVNDMFIGSDDDSPTCPREATVSAVWDQLKKHQVVHVRGPPSSGKSTLAELLEEYVMRISPNTQVYSISWQHPDVLREEGVSGALYYELLNYHKGRPRDRRDWLRMRNMLRIIDEAQGSYQYDNLWTQFIKRISQDGDQSRWIILFSSYGSPAATPITRGPVGSPPIRLSADQRVSVRSLSANNQEVSLYFTRPEF